MDQETGPPCRSATEHVHVYNKMELCVGHLSMIEMEEEK